MELNQALNLKNCQVELRKYKDYRDPETQHFDLNRNFNDRTFDINPMTIQYNTSQKDPYMDPNTVRYHQLTPIGPQPHQPQGLQPHALPEVIGQSLLMDQSYFPSPVSNQQPQAEMSSAYLQMKQLQETQTLLESSNSNSVALDRLKREQAMELQQNLQRQKSFNVGPQGLNAINNQHYAPTSSLKTINQTCAYNAQGEAVADPSSLYQDRNNKYKQLKQMSPEMLNRMYGRQSDQSVLPESDSQQLTPGDIYDQTSCFRTPQTMSMKSHDQLKNHLDKRKQEILAQRSRQGIQCYDQSGCGTNIDEAFRS